MKNDQFLLQVGDRIVSARELDSETLILESGDRILKGSYTEPIGVPMPKEDLIDRYGHFLRYCRGHKSFFYRRSGCQLCYEGAPKIIWRKGK